ncbi:MAG: SDR family oxidoreductase [Chloroflexi bacterium]|nr:SDR family oxidoreductase [Chloroflexota bacterium]
MARLLEGKVAVVTGSGRGIGRGIALLMAQHGAQVVVNDVGAAASGTGSDVAPAQQVVEEIQAQGGQAVANYDSVASWQGGESIVKAALDSFGRIDILVNNAGILRDRMIFNMAEEEWDAVIAVHLKGTFACTRHACTVMRQQRYGRIVNFVSSTGLYGNSGQANYGAAKEAIAGFTRQVSRDLGRYGITCNAIMPSAWTRMTQAIPGAAAEARARAGIAWGTGAEQAVRGDPEDVAPMAVFLATDHAAHINGQFFYAAGGLAAFLGHPIPVRTIHKQGVWTPEEIARLFPVTLGMDLVNPAPPQPA